MTSYAAQSGPGEETGTGPVAQQQLLALMVRRLPAEPDAGAAPIERRLADAATEALGPSAVAWACARGRETAAGVAAANPDLPNLPTAAITQAATRMLLGVLHDLAGIRLPDGWPRDQTAIARDAVTRGLPFERVVAEMRRGQERWTSALLTTFGESAPSAVFATVALVVARQVDTAVDAVIAGWLQEREQQLSGAAARRRRLVELLVDGRSVDGTECRSLLGVDLGHLHLALLLRGPGDRGSTVSQETAGRVGRLTGAATTFLHQATDDTVWAWVSHPRRLDASRLDEVRARLSDNGQRLAVGAVRRGAAGFRDSHLDARAVDRLPQPIDGGSPLVRYRDADLAALLAADMDQARRFVRDHLGPLARPDPALGDLQKTLATYYRTNASLLAAASALNVHRNTVVYRLRRIEQLLGHPVTERMEHVQSALTLVEHFGPLVCSEAAS